MSLPEVAAAVSVLLGFAPPSTLSASGSSKVLDCLISFAEVFVVNYVCGRKVLIMLLVPFLQLNGMLMPNPLDRPRSVFMLEIRGAHGLCSNFENEIENEIENVILGCKFFKGVDLF